MADLRQHLDNLLLPPLDNHLHFRSTALGIGAGGNLINTQIDVQSQSWLLFFKLIYPGRWNLVLVVTVRRCLLTSSGECAQIGDALVESLCLLIGCDCLQDIVNDPLDFPFL